MRAFEFIDSDLDEGPTSVFTIRDAKKILTSMGFQPTGRKKGSHDIWKDTNGVLFTVPLFGKELSYGVSKNLIRIMKDRGVEF